MAGKGANWTLDAELDELAPESSLSVADPDVEDKVRVCASLQAISVDGVVALPEGALGSPNCDLSSPRFVADPLTGEVSWTGEECLFTMVSLTLDVSAGFLIHGTNETVECPAVSVLDTYRSDLAPPGSVHSTSPMSSVWTQQETPPSLAMDVTLEVELPIAFKWSYSVPFRLHETPVYPRPWPTDDLQLRGLGWEDYAPWHIESLEAVSLFAAVDSSGSLGSMGSASAARTDVGFALSVLPVDVVASDVELLDGWGDHEETVALIRALANEEGPVDEIDVLVGFLNSGPPGPWLSAYGVLLDQLVGRVLETRLEDILGGDLDVSEFLSDALGGFGIDSVSLPNLDPEDVQGAGLVPSLRADAAMLAPALRAVLEEAPLPVEVVAALWGQFGHDANLGTPTSGQSAQILVPVEGPAGNLVVGVYQRILGDGLALQALSWEVRSGVHRYALQENCWTATWGGKGRCGEHVLIAPVGEALSAPRSGGSLWLFEPRPITAATTWKPGRP